VAVGGDPPPCSEYGPAYNQDNMCYDKRPVPLSVTRIPVPADAPIFPRQTILLVHVSKEGTTLEARVFGPSNLDAFNDQALDMAKTLRWKPAEKNGEPVDGWVQWQFQPTRQ
jgi:TonB family protein